MQKLFSPKADFQKHFHCNLQEKEFPKNFLPRLVLVRMSSGTKVVY